MNQDGSIAVGAIVTTWGLALLGVLAALELLWGYPRLIGVGLAVAIAMFVNDVAPVELLFVRTKRIWLWTGMLRGITALFGFVAIFYAAVEFAHGYNERLFIALIAGLIVGGLMGSAVRFVRETREARRNRQTEAAPK